MVVESNHRQSAVMLFKYGGVYPGVNNQYHPYPGDKADGFSEIEVCINWLCQNEISGVDGAIRDWCLTSMANVLIDDPNMSYEDVVSEIFYMDVADLSSNLRSQLRKYYDMMADDVIEEYANLAYPEEYAEKIADFINEKFLRVREGGKLDSNGEDAIYFRISSHGYDWHRAITEYLWDTYGDPKKMPRRIWIGHDLESNPPEKVLFDGTPEELFEKEDRKIYEDLKVFSRGGRNPDREEEIVNRIYRTKLGKSYKLFK